MFLFLATLPLLTYFPLRAFAGSAVIYVNPPVISGFSVGGTFSVVANVSGLYAWSFQLCYKSTVALCFG
jgi:hypothetical protein